MKQSTAPLWFVSIAIVAIVLYGMHLVASWRVEPLTIPAPVIAEAVTPQAVVTQVFMLVVPTMQPTATETPRATPTPVATTVFCDHLVQPGAICRKGYVVATSTPVKGCSDPMVIGGMVCRWEPTETPTPSKELEPWD